MRNDEKFINIKTKDSIKIKEEPRKPLKDKKNKPNNPIQTKITYTDSKIQTNLSEREHIEEATQTIFYKNSEIQTEFKEILQKDDKVIDENRLSIFLKNSLNLVEEALYSRDDEAFELYDEEPDYDFRYSRNLILPMITNDLPKKSKISDFSWNSNGHIMGISYYIDDHIGPCNHQMLLNFIEFDELNQDKSFKKKYVVDTNSCVKAIEAHPLRSNIFAACSYLGEIMLINLNEIDQIQYCSKIDSYFYKELITNVKWIDLFKDGIYKIVSISEDGRLLIWDLDEKLNTPLIGFSLKVKMGKNTIPIHPTSFAENPFDPCEYLVGTIEGNVYKCIFNKPSDNNFDFIFNGKSGVVWRRSTKLLISNMNDKDIIEMKNYIENFCKDKNIIDLNADEFFRLKPDINKLYKNCLKSNFEKHSSIVNSIEYNPFLKNLFATCSYDGSIRIYYQSLGSKYIFSSNLVNEYFTCLSWSIYRSDILATGTSNGKLIIYLICEKNLKPILEVERKIENSMINVPIINIKFNPIFRNILTIAFDDGLVDFISLSEDFYNTSYNDLERLKSNIDKIVILSR